MDHQSNSSRYGATPLLLCLLLLTSITGLGQERKPLVSPTPLPHFPIWPTFEYGLGKPKGNREIQKLGPTDELFLWRVDGENSTVYLMGSIHLLKKSSYPLAPLYEYVYDECNQLVVESNETDSDEHYEYLSNKMLLGGNKKLSHYISSSAYNWIQDLAIDNDLPVDFFNQFKPEAVGVFIAQIKAENYGFDFTLGVDFHFIDKAEDDFIPIYSLEGVERYDLFFTGSLAKQADELEGFINEIKNGKAEKELTEIVDSWLNDYEGMVEYILKGEKKDKKDNDISMKTRNIAWIPKIENYIKQDNVTLVIAGAAHFFGDYSIVKLLENKGYKVNQLHDVDVPSITFETAITNSNIKVLKEYLPFHPNLNLTFKKYINWNPLHGAALSGSIETVELLLENKAKVGIKNNGGLTPLYIAAVKNRYDTCKLLINNGAYVNTRDEVMNTPLHATAQYGYTAIMELLLENGTTVDIRNTDDGWTPLHNAASGGKVESIELLLQNGADINAKSIIGETPLHFAASQGHKEAVESLVSNGASLAAKDDNGKTAYELALEKNHRAIAEYLKDKTTQKTLFQAVKDNDIDSLKKHIAANTDLNQRDEGNSTALHHAALYGFLEFAELLIKNGASINGKNKLEWMALHYAAFVGHLDVVELLINNGALIDAKGATEYTPLHYAALGGHLRVAEFLINKNASIDAKDNEEWTALHVAAGMDHFKIVEILIKNGATIDARQKDGWTALHMAANDGHLGGVEILINNGASIDAKNEAGSTALHRAALGGHLGVVEILIKNRASIDAKDKSGMSALHYAATEGYLEVIESLINNGASINAKSHDNSPTALNFAAFQGHLEVVKLLIKNGASIDLAIIPATANGHLEIVELLIENGALLETKGKDGQTSLHFASEAGNLSIVELLLNSGANYHALTETGKTALVFAKENGHADVVSFLEEFAKPEKSIHQAANDNDIISLRKHIAARTDLDEKGAENWTALHYSAFYGFTEFSEILINNGASIDAKQKDEWTALHFASRHGHLEIVETLIKNGASIDTKEINEWTALHFASRYAHLEIVETLINNGASINAKSIHGWTPLHLAAFYGYTDVASTLIDKGAKTDLLTNAGETALDIAIRKNHTEIQKILEGGAFKISGFKYSGQFQFDINGMKGATFLIEASTDLKLWAPIGEFKNRDGVVNFSDRTSPLFDQQFYRVKVVE